MFKKKEKRKHINEATQFNLFQFIYMAPFKIKESEVKQLAEVKEDESAEDCQAAGHVCRTELGSRSLLLCFKELLLSG